MQEYATDYASFYLPSDQKLLIGIQEVVAQKKALQPTVLVVIGIGGSNLGTLAIHQALNGTLANEEPGVLKVYYADTIGPDYTISYFRS